MPSMVLTPHDLYVLEKIKDPESTPSAPILIDSTLPKDPYITDTTEYDKLAVIEAQIINEFQELEAKIAACEMHSGLSRNQVLADYDTCINKLTDLTSSYP